jgi:hypothetical protein
MFGPGWLSRYSDPLRAGRYGIESRCRRDFLKRVQAGYGAHPAIYVMCTRSFPLVKRPQRGDNRPLPSSAEVKERAASYLCSTSVSFMACYRVNLLLLLLLLCLYCFCVLVMLLCWLYNWHLSSWASTLIPNYWIGILLLLLLLLSS